jgi:L-serine dehydratase
MVSLFDIFKIGIGPSSSHTVGPMLAASRFLRRLERLDLLERVARVRCTLYGSLAFTGRGHGTDSAILLGLSGLQPDAIDPDAIPVLVARIRESGQLQLNGTRMIRFASDDAGDLVFDFKTKSPGHPNGMRLEAMDDADKELANRIYYSVGGGFVVSEDQYVAGQPAGGGLDARQVPYPFRTARALLDICTSRNMTIAEIARANEEALRPAAEVVSGIDRIIAAMMACIERGLAMEGILPGGLKVRRRAKRLYEKARADGEKNLTYPHRAFDEVSAFAMAVNEENAAGGRVVTSPTNGAAGVTPAVLRYYRDLCPGADRAGEHTFLLTAAAFGAIIKYNASLSGAEVGCQGEVGSASAMAAAGLAAALGGTNEQIENAAEIALEHHLGMTCDPVGGLVQVPCIERNTMGAVKAINAASLALAGDGQHIVFFDTVVETMRLTGLDMQDKYKETSQGGLAVTVVEC